MMSEQLKALYLYMFTVCYQEKTKLGPWEAFSIAAKKMPPKQMIGEHIDEFIEALQETCLANPA